MTSPAPAPRPSAARSRWLVPALVLVVVAVLVLVIFTLRDSDGATPAGAAGTTVTTPAATAPSDGQADPAEGQAAGGETPVIALSEVERRSADDVLGLGAVDAPVTLVVFSDYQCGYCARWSTDTFPELLDYVADGALRIEWRDVNIFGADSERAARAAYAAALQGAFVEYHDALFPGGKTRSAAQLTDEALVATAAELGLDAEQFAADFASPAAAAEVARNQELGVQLGAYSTPSFVLAGQPIVGAQPTEVFLQAIEAATAQAGPAAG